MSFAVQCVIHCHLKPLAVSVNWAGDCCRLVSLQRYAWNGDGGVGVAIRAVRCQRDVGLVAILWSQHEVAEHCPRGASQTRHVRYSLIIYSLCNVHCCP